MSYDFDDIDLDEMAQNVKPPKKERAVRLTKKGLPDKRRESSKANVGLARAKVAKFLEASRKLVVSDDEEEVLPCAPPVTPVIVPIVATIEPPVLALPPPEVSKPIEIPPPVDDMQSLRA